MSVQNDYQSQSEEYDATKAWRDGYFDFVLIEEGKPPARIELARERMLICRLYLGLLRTITDDYGAEFATHSDSLAHPNHRHLRLLAHGHVFAGARRVRLPTL